MFQWKENDLTLGEVTLHYTRTGGDKPPLVLIHGFSDNGLCWTPIARAFEQDYDIIMPDMVSHGRSSRVVDGQKIDMASNVAQLIESLHLGTPIVGGHSMGAGVTYDLVVRYPHLVRAFFLEDPAWMLNVPTLTPEMFKNNPMRDWVSRLPSQSFEELLTGYRKDHPTWDDDLLHAMVESKKQLDVNVFDKITQQVFSQDNRWDKTLPNVKQPALVFTADTKKGALVSREAAAKAKELKPDLTIIYVPEAGHLIRFDKPDVYVKELKEFLASVKH